MPAEPEANKCLLIINHPVYDTVAVRNFLGPPLTHLTTTSHLALVHLGAPVTVAALSLQPNTHSTSGSLLLFLLSPCSSASLDGLGDATSAEKPPSHPLPSYDLILLVQDRI